MTPEHHTTQHNTTHHTNPTTQQPNNPTTQDTTTQHNTPHHNTPPAQQHHHNTTQHARDVAGSGTGEEQTVWTLTAVTPVIPRNAPAHTLYVSTPFFFFSFFFITLRKDLDDTREAPKAFCKVINYYLHRWCQRNRAGCTPLSIRYDREAQGESERLISSRKITKLVP
jgi:hypothetical protein